MASAVLRAAASALPRSAVPRVLARMSMIPPGRIPTAPTAPGYLLSRATAARAATTGVASSGGRRAPSARPGGGGAPPPPFRLVPVSGSTRVGDRTLGTGAAASAAPDLSGRREPRERASSAAAAGGADDVVGSRSDYMGILSDPLTGGGDAGLDAGSDGRGGSSGPRRSNLDARAGVKLDALVEARRRYKRARAALRQAEEVTPPSGDGDNGDGEAGGVASSGARMGALLEEVGESRRALALALRQTVKYVGRSREAGAASRAQAALHEMIEKSGALPTRYPLDDDGGEEGGGGSEEAKSTKLKARVMTDMVNGRAPRPASLPDISGNIDFLPVRRDFHNVLHSWASSKARRKGLHAEALLLRMAELAYWYPQHFPMPDSKAFSLVVKCHAGSTHSQALKKIVHLNDLHDMYAGCGVPGIYPHDPFLLMASLKALGNYWKDEELQLADRWLSQLHDFVTDPDNRGYVRSPGDGIGGADTEDGGDLVEVDAEGGSALGGDAEDTDGTAGDDEGPKERAEVCSRGARVDVTGAYTTVIRELAKMRGSAGAADRARSALDRLHEASEDASGAGIATVHVKANAYNLVIGSYGDSREDRHAREALELLDRMVGAWKMRRLGLGLGSGAGGDEARRRERLLRDAPLPTAKSFSLALRAVGRMTDLNTVQKESGRLLDELDGLYREEAKSSEPYIEPTAEPFNAMLELYTKALGKDPELLSKVMGIVKRMNENAVEYDGAGPDVTTWHLVLTACSLVDGDEPAKEKALQLANQTFQRLEDDGSVLTDRSYYHMMCCVANLVPDPVEKLEQILKLFKDACDKGFVSANVLRVFKSHVSDERFKEKVGSGRLADKWIANVTSVKAFYTDGTMGGPGKHARRKGKSTSNWLKKQRKKEEKITLRKKTKAEKKLKRKMQRASEKRVEEAN